MTLQDFIILLVFPAAMAFAAASDLFTMTIPNRLSIVLVAAFFVLALWQGLTLSTIGLHIGAGFAVLVLGFGCFAMNWIGGGDAKLAASAALWFGFTNTLFEFFLVASVFGGFLTLFLLQVRGYPLPEPLRRQDWIMRLHEEKGGIPYGIALAAAGLVLYPDQIFMRALGA